MPSRLGPSVRDSQQWLAWALLPLLFMAASAGGCAQTPRSQPEAPAATSSPSSISTASTDAAVPRATAPAPSSTLVVPPERGLAGAASSASTGQPARDLPLPAAPPGTDPEQARIAASICAAAFLGKNVGCRSHPPFTRPEQLPDGKFVEHKDDPLLFCAIDVVFRGSFTKPGAKQAIVSFSQCMEADTVWDAGNPGSAVLVEEREGRWRAIDTLGAANLALCLQTRRADGRDILLCRSNLGAPPAGNVIYFFLVDFARSPRQGSLAKVFGDMPLCMAGQEGFPSGLISIEVTDMKLVDLNRDGTKDLLVRVVRSRVPPSPALDARVRTACQGDPGMVDLPRMLPPPKVASLELVSNGDSFAPSATTKKLLEAWRAESPDGFNGLESVGPPPLY
jgi:hypothetical protein